MLFPLAAGASDAPAFPQLHFEYWPSQIFWLLVSLVVLYFVLNRVALPRVQSTLEERRDTISNDLDKASEFNLAAEEAEEAYQTALQDARAEAQKIADKTKDAIKQRLDAELAAADRDIAAKAEQSAARLREIQAQAAVAASEVAETTAQALAERFSPRPISSDDMRAAVANRLAGRFGG